MDIHECKEKEEYAEDSECIERDSDGDWILSVDDYFSMVEIAYCPWCGVKLDES